MKPNHYKYFLFFILAVCVFGATWLGWGFYQQHLQNTPVPLGSTLGDFEDRIGQTEFINNMGGPSYSVYVFNDTSHPDETIQYQVLIRENLIASVSVLLTKVAAGADIPNMHTMCQRFIPSDARPLGVDNQSAGSIDEDHQYLGHAYQSDSLARVFSSQVFSNYMGDIPMGMFSFDWSTGKNSIGAFCSLQVGIGFPALDWHQPIQ